MKKTLSIIALALLVIAIGNVIFYCIVDHDVKELFFNSDALYLPTLFADILSEGGRISDWYLTPAPYFFPDYPMYFLAYKLGTGISSQIIIFTTIQILLSISVCWFLARQILQNDAFITAVAIVTGFIWFALIVPMSAFPFLLISAHHYGIFLSAIVCTALWLYHGSQHESVHRSQLLLLICAITFLSTLSDSLFIVQFTVPFAVATLWHDILAKKINIKRLLEAASLVLSSALGSYSYKYVVAHRTRYPHELGFENVQNSLSSIATFFKNVISTQPIYALILMGYAGIILYLSIASIRNSKMEESAKKIAWLATFTFFSFCCTAIATSLVTHPPASARYFLAALSWPIIVLLLFLGQHYRRYAGVGGIIISGITVALLTANSISYLKKGSFETEFYPSDVACIDNALADANISNGIAGYWDAKWLQILSKKNLNIAQYNGRLKRYHWITSERFFRESYDFAIIDENLPNSLPRDLLTRITGQPAKTLTCGSKHLYLYDKNALILQKITSTRHAYQWQPSELPTRIGMLSDGGNMKKQNVAEAGCLTFGPYEALPVGTYLFEIAYSSPEPPDVLVGRWDAGLVPINKIKFHEGNLQGTSGALSTVTGYFTVAPRHHMRELEIRTFANENTDISLAHIKIQKIE